MTFSIGRKDLLNVLQILSKAIPTRSTLPIISCALFTKNKDNLNIRTTDLEISISINCSVENEESGSIAIPMNKLLEITSAMPDEKINFSISDIGKINIDCQQGLYTIMGQSGDEFPEEQVVEDGTSFTLNGEELLTIINYKFEKNA